MKSYDNYYWDDIELLELSEKKLKFRKIGKENLPFFFFYNSKIIENYANSSRIEKRCVYDICVKFENKKVQKCLKTSRILLLQ